jgi:hypothetical protein
MPPTRESNAALRRDLQEQRAHWYQTATPIITEEVAATVFERFLAKYPAATPEVIAVELMRRIDGWNEFTAIHNVLNRILQAKGGRQ